MRNCQYPHCDDAFCKVDATKQVMWVPREFQRKRWPESCGLHLLFTLLALSLQFKKLCCKPMSQKRVPLCWQRLLWSHCKRSKLQSCRLHRWKIRGMSRSSSRFVRFSDMFIVYVRQKTFAQATRPEDSRHIFFCKFVFLGGDAAPSAFSKPEPHLFLKWRTWPWSAWRLNFSVFFYRPNHWLRIDRRLWSFVALQVLRSTSL